MNQVRFSLCSTVDFPKVLPLFESYADIFPFQQKRLILQQISQVLEEEVHPQSLFRAEHENSTIGFLGTRREEQDPSRFQLFGFIIKRGYQGQGIGTNLLFFAIPHICRNGGRTLSVIVKSHYPPATRTFYRKHGFKEILDEHYTGASNVEDRLFTCTLATHPAARLALSTAGTMRA